MLSILKTNPTARSEKDPPQTSQQSVHPGGLQSERPMPKSNLHQENVVTGGLNAFLIFDPRFHQCPNSPRDPWAEPFTFDEQTFSDKNPFPARLPSSNRLRASKDLSSQPPSQLPCYHKPPGWPRTKSSASTRESLSLFNGSHFPKFRMC